MLLLFKLEGKSVPMKRSRGPCVLSVVLNLLVPETGTPVTADQTVMPGIS